MAKKVLITGEGGFIGSQLMNRFASSFELTIFPSEFNLLDHRAVSARVSEIKPDLVLHLAGISLPADCDADPGMAYQVNVAGTAILAEALLKLETKPRLVFASTAQVYRPLSAEDPNGVISEGHPVDPINTYARTKRLAELLLEEFSRTKDLPVTVIRLFNHVHRSQKSGTFLSTMLHAIQSAPKNEAMKIPVGNLELYRDMGAIGDLLSAIASVIEHSSRAGGFDILNICNGRPRKLSILAQILSKKLNADAEFFLDPSRLRKGEPVTVVGSHAKLTRATGWKPAVVTDEELIDAFLA